MPKLVAEATTRDQKPVERVDGEAAVARISVVVYSRDGAQVAELAPGADIVVGRGFPADLQLDELSLSRQHARFLRDDDHVIVEDLGSGVSRGCF